MCWNWAIHKTYKVKGGKKAKWSVIHMVRVKKKDVSFYMLKITQEGHKKLVIEVASRDGKNTREEIFLAKNWSIKHIQISSHITSVQLNFHKLNTSE